MYWVIISLKTFFFFLKLSWFEDTRLWSEGAQIAKHPTTTSGVIKVFRTCWSRNIAEEKAKAPEKKKKRAYCGAGSALCIMELHWLQARIVDVHMAHRFWDVSWKNGWDFGRGQGWQGREFLLSGEHCHWETRYERVCCASRGEGLTVTQRKLASTVAAVPAVMAATGRPLWNIE